jgi:hypothetical protein
MSKTIKDTIIEYNIGIQTIVEYLKTYSIDIKPSPNVKLSDFEYELIARKFQIEKSLKDEAINLKRDKSKNPKISIRINQCESEKKKDCYGLKLKLMILKQKTLKRIRSKNQ